MKDHEESTRNQILELIPSGVGVFDVTGDVVRMEYLNDGYYQMLGAARESRRQYAGEAALDAIKAEDRPGLLDEAHASIREARLFHYRFHVLDGSGKYRWIAIRANHVPLDGGAERFYAAYYDISQLMDTQARLRDNEQALRDMLRYSETTHFTYFPMHHRYEILEVPESLSDLPLTMEDFPESFIRYGIPDAEDAEAYRSMVRRIDAGEKEAECNVRLQYAGKKTWYRVHMLSVLSPDGTTIRAVGYAVNIDRFMQAERAFEDAKLRIASMESGALAVGCFDITADRTIGLSSSAGLANTRGNFDEDALVAGSAALRAQNPATRQVLFASARQIPDPVQRRKFIDTCSNAGMRQLYASGVQETTLEYRRDTQNGLIWVSTRINFLSDPKTGNILAFFYTTDINRQTIFRKITTQILAKNYEAVSYYDIETGKIYQESGGGSGFSEEDYGKAVADAVEHYVSAEDAAEVTKRFAVPNILAGLAESDVYTIYYTGRIRDESLPGSPLKRMKTDIYYLDENRDVLVILQTNATAIYEQERERARDKASALRHAERIKGLEAILSGIPAGIAVYRQTKDGTSIVMVNQFLCDLIKASREHMLQMPLVDVINGGTHPDDRQIVLDGLTRLFSDVGRAAFTYRSRIAESDQFIWISAVGQATDSDDGSRMAYVLYTDATGEKQREEEFARKLEELTAAYPSPLIVYHLNLTTNECSEGKSTLPYLETAAPKTVDEGLQILAGMIDGDVPEFLLHRSALIGAFQSGQTRLSAEYQIHYPGDGLCWHEGIVTMLQNPATGDIEAVACAVDISERKRNEEIIRHITEEKFDYIALLDLRANTIEFRNMRPSLQEGHFVLGCPYPYEIYRDFILKGLSSAADRTEYRSMTSLSAISDALEQHADYSFSYTYRDGDTLHRRLAQYGYLGRERGLVLLIRTDITAAYRREQEHLRQIQAALQQAEEANRAKTEFVSRISHDIRTPIGIISNMTTFALADRRDEAKLTSDLEKIQASNTFLLSLINDVLDISKIDSGKIELHPEPYTYQEHAANIRNVMEPMCADKGIHCELLRRRETRGVIVVDKVRINQIVLNLLSNAVKYTPPGGTVRYISDSEDLPDAKIRFGFEIEDTGIGMSEEFQKHMFDPFAQEYDNPGRPKGSTGTGLGLSIVKKIVDMMGGTLTVKSQLGKGTTIRCSIVFPDALRDPNYAETSQRRAETVDTAGRLSGRVLLVEDNAINTEIAVRILQSLGLEADCAENGRQALTRFAASRPGEYRAILMDIQMPIMNGYDATERIRALGRPDAKQIPILAMTADAFSDAMARARQAGMTDYITKPLDPERLRRVLSEFASAPESSEP